MVKMSVEQATMELIDAIHDSSSYRNYIESSEALKKHPEVLNRIAEMRRETVEKYSSADNDDLLKYSEEISNKYQDILGMPEVNIFLDSEAELIDTLRDISDQVINSVPLHVPDGE